MDNTRKKIREGSITEKLRKNIRYGLVWQSVRFRLLKLGIEFTPYYIFQEGTGDLELPVIKGNYSDFSFCFLENEDMKLIGKADSGFPEEKLTELLNSGEKCIGIKFKDEIAAFMWINFTGFSYKDTSIRLKENEAYLWFMYTMEHFRGKNLAPYLRFKSYEILREMGRNVMYSISESFNRPAVRFKKKLNARKLKLILYLQLSDKFRKSITLSTY